MIIPLTMLHLRNPFVFFTNNKLSVSKYNLTWRSKHRGQRSCCCHLDRFVNWFNL